MDDNQRLEETKDPQRGDTWNNRSEGKWEITDQPKLVRLRVPTLISLLPPSRLS